MSHTPLRCAVIGYGPNFGWGRAHARWISATGELQCVAVCDEKPERTDLAREELPGIETYNSVADMLAQADLDVVTIITPHFTHRPLAIQCLQAGKHVVVDKAMCLSTEEASEMIAAAEAAGRTLAVFHNRRHDGNVRAIKDVIARGVIGDVFHIELTAGGFGRPADWWYSNRKLGGGAFYFWGPHAVDWVLDLVGQPIKQLTGFHHKLVWHEFDQEDHAQAVLLFENGVVAEVTWSHIQAIGKPLWRILGTRGAIEDTGDNAIVGYTQELNGPSGGQFRVVSLVDGEWRNETVPYMESDWLTYYQDLAAHLLRGAPVPVSAEQGRRVIGVLELTGVSAREGRSLTPQFP
jgi:scyllo-inositol 2-dehydrogenase (NADP+)